MAYGNLLTDVVQSSTTNTPSVFKDGNGTEVGTLCRAWVCFNGSTATIRSSFNVSSITRNGAGDYTASFTNALPDANYSATCCYSFVSTDGSYNVPMVPYGSVPTTSAVRMGAVNYNSGSGNDSLYVSLQVFR